MVGVLTGCAPTAPDGYTFDRPQYVETKFTTEIVLVDNQAELVKLAPAGTQKFGTELMAFARLNRDQHRCTIYMVDARRAYQPQWLGHELAHCIYGDWHPGQDGGAA